MKPEFLRLYPPFNKMIENETHAKNEDDNQNPLSLTRIIGYTSKLCPDMRVVQDKLIFCSGKLMLLFPVN